MYDQLLQPLGLAEEYGVAFNESGILYEVRGFCRVHPEQLLDAQDLCLIRPVRCGNNV